MFLRFTEQDSFVGYQNDTPASVVFQVTEQLRERQEEHSQVNEEMEESAEWLDIVMERSKSLLVQIASPDALIRLQRTQLADERKNITTTYAEQHHGSIRDFVYHHLQQQCDEEDENEGLLLHVSTTNPLITIKKQLTYSITNVILSSFLGNHTQSLAVLH